MVAIWKYGEVDAHTGDQGDDFTKSKTQCDVTDLVFRYACVQEDVEREGTDLQSRRMNLNLTRGSCSLAIK